MISRNRQSRAQLSLARALSKFGIASRKEAEQLVRAGRVAVNGIQVRSPSLWLDPRTDRIAVDAKPLHASPPVYLALHKPAGYVTTRSDERGRLTVYDLLPAGTHRVFPVGRLDKETSGLLLFTNDSRWAELISGPAHRIPKTYSVTLDRPLAAVHKHHWESGMVLADGTPLLPVAVRPLGGQRGTLEVVLVEGKNRQIRRMAEECGYSVKSLVRTAIGPLRLSGLAEGASRAVTPEERDALSRTAAERSAS